MADTELSPEREANRGPLRGGVEFFVNEEWRMAARNDRMIATLCARAFDPDDERVRVRLIHDDDALLADRDRLLALLNTPELHDFAKVVVLEAAHQREHQEDTWKGDADFFWLIGYLAGKALHNPPKHEMPSREALLHRIITVAAAAANWHAHVMARPEAT